MQTAFRTAHEQATARAVAGEVATAAHPRPEIYVAVHKGLRAAMGQVLATIGRTDPADPIELPAALADLRGLLALCSSHLAAENSHIHAAMEARRPDSAAHTADDHLDHEHAIARLEDAACEVEASHGALRADALLALYRRLALFVAENLVHMQVEETENNAVLWAEYSDAEIDAVHDAILASLAPEKKAAFMRWIVPSVNAAERAAMFSAMRRKAPPGAVDAMLALARRHLPERDWVKLMAAIAPA